MRASACVTDPHVRLRPQFLDGYNLEVFADERVAITTNLFPSLPESVCVGTDFGVRGVGAAESKAHIASLDVWALSAAPITGVPIT